MQQEKSVTIRNPGRPTVLTDNTVAEICQVLQRGYSIQAACNFVGIDRSTFYRHLQTDMEFATRVRYAIGFLYSAATEVIYNKIYYEKDAKLAMWYLQKVDPERFGGRKYCRNCHKLQQQFLARHTNRVVEVGKYDNIPSPYI